MYVGICMCVCMCLSVRVCAVCCKNIQFTFRFKLDNSMFQCLGGIVDSISAPPLFSESKPLSLNQNVQGTHS